MPKKNTGIPYEQFTREVFAHMEDLKKLGATVQHNVVLTGKSGVNHQIDVYVEFTAAGMTHKTLVSCKDHASPAKKGHVSELHDILGDIPGQPRGVLVSRGGFQQGAIDYATHHGILLWHLSEKEEDDWEGRVKEVHITVALEIPRLEFATMELDNEWVKAELAKMGITSGQWRIRVGGEHRCVWESGKETTWNELFNPHMPTEPNTVVEVPFTFKNDRPMMRAMGVPLERIPANGFTARLSYSVHEEPIVIDFDQIVAFCLRDIVNNKSRFLRADGGPPQP